jgi:hemoglobin
MKRAQLLFSLALGAVALAAAPARAAEKSLYERLGGEPAVTAVVDDFVGRAAADPKVDFTRHGKYDKVDVPRLKKQLVNLVGQLTGGPQKYTGKDMKTLHKGMKITAAQFDAMAADLVASLDKFKVPAKEKGELLTIVGSTKNDIVEASPPAHKKHRDRRKS